MAPVDAQDRSPQGRPAEEDPPPALPRGRERVGGDHGPLRSKKAVRSPFAEARDPGIPEHDVRLCLASRRGEEEDRGPAEEDLRHFALVHSDEGRGEELVGEDGPAVPAEPWYAEPGRIAVEEGLDENVWDPPAVSLLIIHLRDL